MKRSDTLIISLFLISILLVSGCGIQRDDILNCFSELTPGCLRFDLNDDGFVNILDLVISNSGGSKFRVEPVSFIGTEKSGRGATMEVRDISATDGPGTLNIYTTATDDIYGFQFSLTGAYFDGASGGVAGDIGYMFTVGCEGECVIAFSFSGTPIPSTSFPDNIIQVSFSEHYGGDICFKEGEGDSGPYNIISAEGGIEMDAEWYDACNPPPGVTGCMISTACNYDADATIPCTSLLTTPVQEDPKNLFDMIKLFFMRAMGVQRSDLDVEEVAGDLRENECCEYAEENYDCDGNCIADTDCTGECGGTTPDYTGTCAAGCGGGCNDPCDPIPSCSECGTATDCNYNGCESYPACEECGGNANNCAYTSGEGYGCNVEDSCGVCGGDGSSCGGVNTDCTYTIDSVTSTTNGGNNGWCPGPGDSSTGSCAGDSPNNKYCYSLWHDYDSEWCGPGSQGGNGCNSNSWVFECDGGDAWNNPPNPGWDWCLPAYWFANWDPNRAQEAAESKGYGSYQEYYEDSGILEFNEWFKGGDGEEQQDPLA